MIIILRVVEGGMRKRNLLEYRAQSRYFEVIRAIIQPQLEKNHGTI